VAAQPVAEDLDGGGALPADVVEDAEESGQVDVALPGEEAVPPAEGASPDADVPPGQSEPPADPGP